MPVNRKGLAGAGLLLTGVLIAAQTLCALPLQAQDKTVPKKKAVAPLALTAKTDHPTYHADSAMRFTLAAKNTTQMDIPVRFNNGQHYDFVLFRGKDAKGEKIWQWSKGMMFTMALGSILVKPSKPLEFTETYCPGVGGMPALASGFYTVTATLKGAARTIPPISMPSASTTFQID